MIPSEATPLPELTPAQAHAAYVWVRRQIRKNKPGTLEDWIRARLTPEGTIGKKAPTSRYGPPGRFDADLARRHRNWCVNNKYPNAPFQVYLAAVARWKEHQCVPPDGLFANQQPSQAAVIERTREILRRKGLLPNQGKPNAH